MSAPISKRPSRTHGRTLQKLFLEAAVIVSTGVTTSALVMSCGGSVADDDGADAASVCVVETVDAPPPTPTTCSAMWTVPVRGEFWACGFPGTLTLGGAECDRFCGSRAYISCSYETATSTVSCMQSCPAVDGRRFDTLEELEASEDVAAYLARSAYYEAASVEAFAILAAELRAHGAPSCLLVSIRRARRDERAHAKRTSLLARRRGVVVRRPRGGRRGIRGLLPIALENAREGCVGESLAASLAFVQADAATDPALRAHYARIARDESRHAALSFRVHAWLMPRLSGPQRALVGAALHAAFADARLALPAAESARVLGLPSERAFRAMVDHLAGELLDPMNVGGPRG